MKTFATLTALAAQAVARSALLHEVASKKGVAEEGEEGTYPDIFKYQDRELFISKRTNGFKPMFICSDPEISKKI